MFTRHVVIRSASLVALREAPVALRGNQRFSAQHYNQNYSVLRYQARSAPLVSNGRPARKAIILIIFYYLFKNNYKINHFNVLFDLLLPTAFAARRIGQHSCPFAYLGTVSTGTEGFSCSGCLTLSPLGYDGSIAYPRWEPNDRKRFRLKRGYAIEPSYPSPPQGRTRRAAREGGKRKFSNNLPLKNCSCV